MDLHELVFNYERAACRSGHLFCDIQGGPKSKPQIFAYILQKRAINIIHSPTRDMPYSNALFCRSQ